MGPYKWHSQFFELFSFLIYLRCTLNDIDSQAQVEHHSITGVWKGFFFGGGNKSSVDTCMLISVYGHVFLDYKKTELHAEDVGEKCLYVYVYVYVYVPVYVYI